MLRRLNGTGRQTIRKADVHGSVHASDDGSPPALTLDVLILTSYAFPPNAPVRLEAWAGNAYQRWDLGTAHQLAIPDDMRLTDLQSTVKQVWFRVIVSSPDGDGRLLGQSHRLRFEVKGGAADGRQSLIPLEERTDLGDVVWRVDFGDDGDAPVLRVNADIPDISRTVRTDPTFRALVMPEVLRIVLTHMVCVAQAHPDDGDEDSVWAPWFDLANKYAPDAVLDVSADAVDHTKRLWVDTVVNAMSSKRILAAKTYKEGVE